MELLGPSLEDSFQASERRFNLQKVVTLGDQMISRAQYVHEKNFLHRDIKPDNFAFGIGDEKDTVYLLDFGLSKKFKSSRTGQHIAYRDGKSLTGTARYASINSHRGLEQSRRDDLESIGYVLVYFIRGSLPWQGLQIKPHEDRYVKIMEKKETTALVDLCKGYPDEFVTYLNYCKTLKFEERPNYELLRALLRDIATRAGFRLGSGKTPNSMSL